MKNGIPTLLLLLCLNPAALADIWYASPTASASGDGSMGNPWLLQTALTNNAAILPGDTLYLRGGTYVGGFYCTLGTSLVIPITVSSYPGEWAIVTDGKTGILETPMTTNSNAALIGNSQNWYPAMAVSIDNEVCQVDTLGAASNAAGIWRLNRAWAGTTNTPHSIGAKVISFAQDIIAQTGTNVIFRDFEITSSMTTNRVATYAYYPGAGLNLLASGKANKAVDLIIHNTGHPAIGFWSQGDGGEINGCVIWGTGQYDYTAGFNGDIRGAGAYSQNITGSVLLKNNISFRNFTYGLKGFGETGPVHGFQFINNVCFQAQLNAGGFPIEIASGSTPMDNNNIYTNYVMGLIHAGYVSRSNTAENVVGNVIVNAGLSATEFISGTYSNNTVFIPATATATDNGTISFDEPQSVSKGALAMTWDYNTYYFANNSHPHQFAYLTKDIIPHASDGSGNLLFQNDVTNSWKNFSGFDTHSTYATNWPTNYLKIAVQPLDYDLTRLYICVISTSGQPTAPIVLSNFGYTVGQSYQLIDAQNWPVVVATGTYAGGAINLPLNLSAISPISGNITHYTNEHTNVKNPGLFNSFILHQIPSASSPPDPRTSPLASAPLAPPTNLRVISP